MTAYEVSPIRTEPKKRSSVAAKGRGLFKLKKHIEDVDVEIRKGSIRAASRELREIRRR